MSLPNNNNIYNTKCSKPNILLDNIQPDEKIIHINKYRFMDFYYEELDKLNTKYYITSTDEPSINHNNMHMVFKEADMCQPQPNITPSLPVTIPYGLNIRRYRLDNFNNQSINTGNTGVLTHSNATAFSLNSPPNQSVHRLSSQEENTTMTVGELDFSLSPPLTGSRSSNTSLQFNSLTESIPIINDAIKYTNFCGYYTPSQSHQTIVKRVYDNYLCINIDNIINVIYQYSIPQNNYQTYQSQTNQLSHHSKLHVKYPGDIQNIINATYDFISDQCWFLSTLVKTTDPFNLFNQSTIGLLFDRMNKVKFTFQLAYCDFCIITNGLTSKLAKKQNIKQGILDSAIGILKNTVDELSQHDIAIASVLIKSLTDFINWIYTNYSFYWMSETQIQISLNLAAILSNRFGIQVVDSIYTTLKKYFIPSYLFSVSRTCWKFTHIHKREIANLRGLLIPQCHKNQWIFKCIDHARSEIPWVFPNTPHRKNTIVFLDGRNCFYADEYLKISGGVNLELLRQFLNLPEYHNNLADLVYAKIINLMTGGRQLINCDPRYVIPVIIFNERHRAQIQQLVPENRVIIYTPRGQDDDLMTLYLWLSNPGSFIASNDNYGNYAARLSQSYPDSLDINSTKYYEGLWSELTRCFKLVNPIRNINNGNGIICTENKPVPNKNTFNFGIQPGTSAPF